MSDISKTIRDKGFVSFYCQVSDTGSVGWASSFMSDLCAFVLITFFRKTLIWRVPNIKLESSTLKSISQIILKHISMNKCYSEQHVQASFHQNDWYRNCIWHIKHLPMSKLLYYPVPTLNQSLMSWPVGSLLSWAK